jgi:hypothetical protein
MRVISAFFSRRDERILCTVHLVDSQSSKSVRIRHVKSLSTTVYEQQQSLQLSDGKPWVAVPRRGRLILSRLVGWRVGKVEKGEGMKLDHRDCRQYATRRGRHRNAFQESNSALGLPRRLGFRGQMFQCVAYQFSAVV